MSDDFHYKTRSFRIADDVYEQMREQRGEISWNKYFKKLITKQNYEGRKFNKHGKVS